MLGNSTRVGADWSVVVCPGSVGVCPDGSVVRWFAQITVGEGEGVVSNPSLTPGAFLEDAQLQYILEPWTIIFLGKPPHINNLGKPAQEIHTFY